MTFAIEGSEVTFMLLILGKNGQLAQALAECLPSSGHKNGALFLGRQELDLAEADNLIEAIIELRPGGIINASAWTAVDLAETQKDSAYRLNALVPEQLAIAAEKLDIPFIHVSTDYVHSGASGQPWREDDPIAPLNYYGETKAAGEKLIARTSANYCIIRTSWVFSPFANNFVKTMFHLAQTRPKVSVVNDQTGRPTAARDLATACIKVLEKLHGGEEIQNILNFANSGSCTWADLADQVFDDFETITNKPRPELIRVGSKDFPTTAARPSWSVLDTTAIEALGVAVPAWRPRIQECYTL